MKKLMIAAAAICAATLANAATCSWTLTKVEYSDSAPYVDGTTAGKYVAYLVDQSYANYASVDALVAALQKDGASASGVIQTATGIDKFLNDAHTMTFSVTTTALTSEPQTYTSGMAINAYSVIFDASDPAKAANYMVAYKEGLKFNNSLNLSATSFGSQAANTWQSVPEPTSGLLLLLGVAGLALRRRRA